MSQCEKCSVCSVCNGKKHEKIDYANKKIEFDTMALLVNDGMNTVHEWRKTATENGLIYADKKHGDGDELMANLKKVFADFVIVDKHLSLLKDHQYYEGHTRTFLFPSSELSTTTL